MQIQDPRWKNSDPGRKEFAYGMEKIRIRDKNLGSATLLLPHPRTPEVRIACTVDLLPASFLNMPVISRFEINHYR
jgi:hypothetical protein